jgi:hypothetical protein
MTEKNKGRILTCVFRIEDDDKFRPVWDSMKSGSSKPLGAFLMCIAEGDRMTEMERELNVWTHFQDDVMNSRKFNELFDELTKKHEWKDTENWYIHRCVSEIAAVWQPEDC